MEAWIEHLQAAYQAGYYRTEAAVGEQTPLPWSPRSGTPYVSSLHGSTLAPPDGAYVTRSGWPATVATIDASGEPSSHSMQTEADTGRRDYFLFRLLRWLTW